jgi:methyl-accepting chemotaxis protein
MKLTSLRAKLLVPTVSLSVLVMLAAAGAGTALVVQQLSARFHEQATQTVEFVAHVSSPYVTNYDLTALGNFVKELTRDKQVAYAEYLDADGKSLTADVMAAPANASGLLVVERELKDSSGKALGRFRAGFRDSTTAMARDMVLGSLGGMLAVLGVVIGLMLWSVRHVMRVIGAEPGDAVAVADSISRGDLSRAVSLRDGDKVSLMSALGRMQNHLRQLVGEIRQASTSVQVASAEIAQGHADLSSRTEEQASSLEETAASMEQMTATVSQNAENARKASEQAGTASEIAARGGEAVGAVVSTMTGISESSKKISDIIGVIDGIAFQTNILALNAAVEAARAGEQGRGFAVVASEVRSLAQRSAAAAKEIRDLISDSVGRIEAGSRQVGAAGSTMGEIVESVKRVTDLISEISAASQEQSQNISQVSGTVQQLEKVTQQNAAMVEQANAASASMQEQAGVLMRAVSSFTLDAQAEDAAARAPRPAAAPAANEPRAEPTKVVALPKQPAKAPAVALEPRRKRAAGKRGVADEEGWEQY